MQLLVLSTAGESFGHLRTIYEPYDLTNRTYGDLLDGLPA